MEPIRERWTSRRAFLAAAFGGSALFWGAQTLPDALRRHGGGAFVIPYLLAMAVVAAPLVALEYGLGLTRQAAAPKALRETARRFEWIGWLAVVAGWLVACFAGSVAVEALRGIVGIASPAASPAAVEPVGGGNVVAARYDTLSAGIGAGFWLVAWLIAAGGAPRVGRVLSPLAAIGLSLLLVALAAAVAGDPDHEGLRVAFTPDFGALRDPACWRAACAQALFTVALGQGTLTAFAGFLPTRTDVANNARMTASGATVIAVLGGAAAMSFLGVSGAADGEPVSDLLARGPAMVLSRVPAAIDHLDFLPWDEARLAARAAWLVFVAAAALGVGVGIVRAAAVALGDKFNLGRGAAALLAALPPLAGAMVAAAGGKVGALPGALGAVAPGGLCALAALLGCVAIGWGGPLSGFMARMNAVSETRVGARWRFAVRWLAPAALLWVVVEWARSLAPAGEWERPDWLALAQPAAAVGSLMSALLLARLGGHGEAEPFDPSDEFAAGDAAGAEE
ncbi:MAG: hypothetical protein HY719_11495 [Planctomycetes bacterium]|nr:hypothetical protein [Planctomycetota bacterium]